MSLLLINTSRFVRGKPRVGRVMGGAGKQQMHGSSEIRRSDQKPCKPIRFCPAPVRLSCDPTYAVFTCIHAVRACNVYACPSRAGYAMQYAACHVCSERCVAHMTGSSHGKVRPVHASSICHAWQQSSAHVDLRHLLDRSTAQAHASHYVACLQHML